MTPGLYPAFSFVLRPIQEVLRDYYARQRSALEAQTERQRVQKILAERQEKDQS